MRAELLQRAKEVVEEAAAETVDTDAVEVKAGLLKKAAENIAGVMPIVATITLNLVTQLLKFKH